MTKAGPRKERLGSNQELAGRGPPHRKGKKTGIGFIFRGGERAQQNVLGEGVGRRMCDDFRRGSSPGATVERTREADFNHTGYMRVKKEPGPENWS